MKATIKSFILICTLGFIVFSNANASGKYELDGLMRFNSSLEIEKVNSSIITSDAIANPSFDYQKEAQYITHLIVDATEAKVTQEIIERQLKQTDNSENDGVDNDRIEAQLVTKGLADTAEANAMNKLISDGRIAENR